LSFQTLLGDQKRKELRGEPKTLSFSRTKKIEGGLPEYQKNSQKKKALSSLEGKRVDPMSLGSNLVLTSGKRKLEKTTKSHLLQGGSDLKYTLILITIK